MSGYIVVAFDCFNNIYFVSNTSPILWVGDQKLSKIFSTFQEAKHELEDNFISLSATILYANIKTIFIYEYKNGIEIGKEKFL